MKKPAYILLALSAALALTAPAPASAEKALELEGTLQAARTVTLLAPYSGVVSDVEVKTGDALAAGDALLSIATAKTYADFDGTVTGVFAVPGDSAASV